MNEFLTPKINNIEEYLPNVTPYRIRMDANESPFSLSDGLRAKLAETIASVDFNRYPDPYASALIGEYSRIIGIKAANIVCGNGSDELISIITNAFLTKDDTAVVLSPDFSMYAFYDGIIEAKTAVYEKPEGYEIDFSAILGYIKACGAKMIIFSNPCNPTSYCCDRETILNFVRSCPCLCVVDEAYMDFSNKDASILKQEIVDSTPNLIILKTLSKLGLAALRVGFAIACEDIIRGIKKVKSPYNVNSASQAAAAQALRSYDEFSANIAEIKRNTARLYEILSVFCEVGGYKTIKPDTNFVTLWFDDGEKARRIFEALHEKSISVRYTCRRCLRVTCGTKAENDEFIDEFKKLL